MQIIKGKYNQAHVMIDEIDDTTRSQIQDFVNNPSFQGPYIAIMPDAHKGEGSCIGFTMQMNDRIIPDVVGVDIGCLDKDTEFLSPFGWIKISEYKGEQVAQYHRETDTMSFVSPEKYIVLPCDHFFKFKGHNGLDMLLSEEHKMLVWLGYKRRGYSVQDIIASDFVKHHNILKKGIQGGVKTVFGVKMSPLDITNEDIRIIVMISADGRIRYNIPTKPHVELRFKKSRKITRAKELLEKGGLIYKEHLSKDGVTTLSFSGKEFYTKNLSIFWKASQEQLKIVAEESEYWDGSRTIWGQPTFSTTLKTNADIIQYAYATTGIRMGITEVVSKDKTTYKAVYNCYGTKNPIVGFPPTKIETISSIDRKKYCFTVPSGYFIARRNNNIFITGNCGMLSAKFDADNIDRTKFDEYIHENIPAGFKVNNTIQVDISEYWRFLSTVRKLNIDEGRVLQSIGTLGGGNHFIEAGYGSDGKVWITIHSGSRNFGLKIAEYHSKIAKTLCKKWGAETCGIPFLLVDSLEGRDYINDQKLGVRYAQLNRKVMMKKIEGFFKSPPIDIIESIHNFIDSDGMIRKGATPAHESQRVIIPFNMRDGLIICKGKGNKKYNYSAPHGAGRILSRSKAKELLDVEYFQEDMKQSGVYTTTANESTLDESPDAYKDMNLILDNIKETVYIIESIRPVYSFKAGEKKNG